MDIKLKIGQRIRAVRETKNMAQKDLAYAADLDRTYIASVECGKRNISIVNIEKISNALGVSLKELFEDTAFEEVKTEM
jgi:transcriptional regulator with XRE-family HTH domain